MVHHVDTKTMTRAIEWAKQFSIWQAHETEWSHQLVWLCYRWLRWIWTQHKNRDEQVTARKCIVDAFEAELPNR